MIEAVLVVPDDMGGRIVPCNRYVRISYQPAGCQSCLHFKDFVNDEVEVIYRACGLSALSGGAF